MDGTAATCTATVTRTWVDGNATASAEGIVATQAGAATAEVTVDRALLTASLLRVQRRRARVYIGGEEMTRLVGSISIDESLDSPVPVATFELLTERLSRHDRATLTWGERPVTITLTTGFDLLETWTVFEGVTEASENDGVNIPRGSIRAVGAAGAWAEAKGCVRYGAFAGKHRGGLIKALADSLGVTISNPGIETFGAIVNRPFEANGVLLFEFTRRILEIEGGFCRVNGDELEIVSEYEAISGPPIHEFEPSNYFSLAEVVPSRPVTKWVLSGSIIPEKFLHSNGTASFETVELPIEGTDEDGKPWRTITRITTDRGVEVYREVEEWRTVAADGVTPGPEMLQITKRTTVTTRTAEALFGDGFFHYTTQKTSRTTTIYELTGTPCTAAFGWEWDGGGSWVEEGATLTKTVQLDEYWTWYPSDDALKHRRCTLKTYVTSEQRLYSPELPFSAIQYPDGKYRSNSWYEFLPVVGFTDVWTDGRDQVPPYVRKDRSIWRYVMVIGGLYPDGEQTVIADKEVELWQDDGSGAGHRHTIDRATAAIASTLKPFEWARVTDEIVAKPIPGPEVGSTATAQIQQQVVIDVFDASAGLPFTAVSQSEVIEGVEYATELRPIALRRLRTALGVVLDIRPRGPLPGLKLADAITVTGALRRDGGRVRSLNAARGYVLGRGIRHEVTKGRTMPVVRVLILPEWPT